MLSSTDFLSGFCRRSSDAQRHRLRLLVASVAAASPQLQAMFDRTVVMNAGGGSDGDSDDDDDEGEVKARAPLAITAGSTAAAAAPTTTALVESSPTKARIRNQGDGVCRVTLERPSRRTTLDAIAHVCKFVSAPSRLFFMCGSECKVMRSADRCRTWKTMSVVQAAPASSNTDVNDAMGGTGAAAAEADDISPKKAPTDAIAALLATLPPRAREVAARTIGGERGAAIAVGAAAAAAKSVKAKVDDLQLELLCIAAHSASGHVVACGTRGAMFYSTDKGQSLRRVSLPESLRGALSLRSGAGSDTAVEGEADDDNVSTTTSPSSTTIRHVALLAPGCALVAVGNSVVQVLLDLTAMVPRACHVLMTEASPCRFLNVTSLPTGRNPTTEVVASFTDRVVFLTFRASEGTLLEAVAIEHALGTVLSLFELPSSAAIEALPPPQPLKAAMTADKRHGTSGGSTAAKTEFSYAAETVVSEGKCVHLANRMHTLNASKSSAAGVPPRARVFATYSAGGRVVPYDATCALWLWTQEADEATRSRLKLSPGALTAVSSVSNVAYMPFVQQQSKKEKVGIVALGPACATWVRSGEAGIAVSTDHGATWSPPQLALMGKALLLDSEEAVVVSNKPAIATLAPNEERSKRGGHRWKRPGGLSTKWQLMPLPREARMAVVYDACSML